MQGTERIPYHVTIRGRGNEGIIVGATAHFDSKHDAYLFALKFTGKSGIVRLFQCRAKVQ